MSIDEAFRALILSDESVTELIGDRVEPGTNTIDLNTGVPKAVYTCIDDSDEYSDDGRVGISRAIYQIDVFAASHVEANLILQAITDVIDNFSGEESGITFDWITRISRQHNATVKTPGANTGVKRISRDFRVIYRES